MILFNDLREQWAPLREEAVRLFEKTIIQGPFILGPEVRLLESEFATVCGTKEAVAVSSGTEALRLTLSALGIGAGDAVITVPMTAVPTVGAIWETGAWPLFVDVDAASGTMNPEKIQALIDEHGQWRAASREFIHLPTGRRVKAVVPVHLYGRPADMAAILGIAGRYGLAVIEDASHAHGAVYKGRPVGAWGMAGCFSCYPTKILGAAGDAGLISLNDEALACRLRSLRHHGQDAQGVHRLKGFNSRLDEVQAALLRLKLRYLEGWVQERRWLAERYRQKLKGGPWRLPEEPSDAKPSYHLFVLQLPQRDALRDWLDRQGVQTLVHYPLPVHRQPAYQDLGYTEGSFPESERMAQEVLSLPLYPGLAREAQDQVIQALLQFAESRVSRVLERAP